MRIIGGEWRGRKIEEPRGRDVTRPTTDRVREACASMVMSAFDFDLDEVRVLDAFGGAQEAWEARETEEFRQAAGDTAFKRAAQLDAESFHTLVMPVSYTHLTLPTIA